MRQTLRNLGSQKLGVKAKGAVAQIILASIIYSAYKNGKYNFYGDLPGWVINLVLSRSSFSIR